MPKLDICFTKPCLGKQSTWALQGPLLLLLRHQPTQLWMRSGFILLISTNIEHSLTVCCEGLRGRRLYWKLYHRCVTQIGDWMAQNLKIVRTDLAADPSAFPSPSLPSYSYALDFPSSAMQRKQELITRSATDHVSIPKDILEVSWPSPELLDKENRSKGHMECTI